MSSQTESCEGSGLRTDKAVIFPEENSLESLKTFIKPTLRPIVTCSSPSSSFSSSSCSSASSSPCSIFGASKSVESGTKTENISDVSADTDVSCSSDEICTTPKAKEYRIPEFLPCPPAPRKRRVRSRFHSVPLTRFFVVPSDLDSMFSIHKIPVRM